MRLRQALEIQDLSKADAIKEFQKSMLQELPKGLRLTDELVIKAAIGNLIGLVLTRPSEERDLQMQMRIEKVQSLYPRLEWYQVVKLKEILRHLEKGEILW